MGGGDWRLQNSEGQLVVLQKELASSFPSSQISNKSHCKFIVFDICEFYPSISEELLSKAVNWAKGIVSITPEETEIIFKSKQSLLWHKDEAWMKKGDGDVDVTMGSYDGAETCDLVGLYLLDQMKDLGIECGLYKDDGLAVSSLTRQLTENVKKKICAIEEIFNTAVPPYQQAISDAGYNYKLKFQPPTASPPPKRELDRLSGLTLLFP